jgi:hypothetical protein
MSAGEGRYVRAPHAGTVQEVTMFWTFMALVVLLGGMMMLLRRRQPEQFADEPWRASLREDDEPLDMDEIRRAEDEWLTDSGWEGPDEEESWR